MSDDFLDERWNSLLGAVRGVRWTSEQLRPRTEHALRAATHNRTVVAARRARQESAFARHRAQLERLEAEVGGLRSAMETRAVIEQAKGMVMLRDHCDADTAFHTLVRASQASHHKLRDVATMIVQWGSSGVSVPRGGRETGHELGPKPGHGLGAGFPTEHPAVPGHAEPAASTPIEA